MTHDFRPSNPINRPATNARHASASELARAMALPQEGGQDFLGLNADFAARATSHGATPQPASAPEATPSTNEQFVGPCESWLFDRPEEAAAVSPAPVRPAVAPEEPPRVLNTSWSESSREFRKSRWVAPMLALCTIATVALVGYPALDRATDGPPASDARLRRLAADVARPSAAHERGQDSGVDSGADSAEPSTAALAVVSRLEPDPYTQLTPSKPSEPAATEAGSAFTDRALLDDPFVVEGAEPPAEPPMVRTSAVELPITHALATKPELEALQALQPETTPLETAQIETEQIDTTPLETPLGALGEDEFTSTLSAPRVEPAPAPSAKLLARREARARDRARRQQRLDELRAAALASEVNLLPTSVTLASPEPAIAPAPVATPTVALQSWSEHLIGAPALLELLASDLMCGPCALELPTEPLGESTPETSSGNPRVTRLDIQALVLGDVGVSKARGDRAGVWNETRVPLEGITRTQRLSTPRVGRVRVTLHSGEIFEGRMNAVGEGCVWIETGYGRMGLNGTLVRSVERLDMEASESGGLRRVRVSTAGGEVTGVLESDDGTTASVLLDSGARMSTPSSSLQKPHDAQAGTVRLKRRE
ncbi:MAG: hypothetical protein FJ294_05195 [Planctomycetes bacterium]|nr:hypothetical protein [Planctomycetota bacterium]